MPRAIVFATLALWVLTATTACGPGAERASTPAEAPLSAAAVLGGDDADTAGYARADRVREFAFPADHGAHPDFRTEWWYVTGHLDPNDGARADDAFGFQFTIFRSALAPESPERPSPWATRQAYLGHFTLTDPNAPGGGRFDAFERSARGSGGLAGATEAGAGPPYRVWLGPWSLTWPGGAQGTAAGETIELSARHLGDDGRAVGLELTLTPEKAPVLQGDRGLSPKGPEPGNASYYYSLPRLAARGRVTVGTADDIREIPVTGEAWLDREWSTSALGADEVGWDWFSLQLEGDREVMLYRIRRRDGGAAATSRGVWVRPDGSTRTIPWDEVELEELGTWASPRGATYPSGWRLRWPAENLDVRVTPVLEDQELDVSFRYWEGAVAVEGSHQGRGYVELVGY